jgi:hypothetical protein
MKDFRLVGEDQKAGEAGAMGNVTGHSAPDERIEALLERHAESR